MSEYIKNHRNQSMDVRGDVRRLLFWRGIGLSAPAIIKPETYGPSMMSIIYLSSESFRLNIDRERESFIKLFSKHLLYLAELWKKKIK